MSARVLRSDRHFCQSCRFFVLACRQRYRLGYRSTVISAGISAGISAVISLTACKFGEKLNCVSRLSPASTSLSATDSNYFRRFLPVLSSAVFRGSPLTERGVSGASAFLIRGCTAARQHRALIERPASAHEHIIYKTRLQGRSRIRLFIV